MDRLSLELLIVELTYGSSFVWLKKFNRIIEYMIRSILFISNKMYLLIEPYAIQNSPLSVNIFVVNVIYPSW